MLPITRFVKGVEGEVKDPNKISLKEQKVDKPETNKITKITTFINHKPREQIIKHKLILDDIKKKEPAPVEASKEEIGKKDVSETKKENDQNESKEADKKKEENKH